MRRVSAIIVAAGKGKRFGASKQFALLKGKSILDRCLEKFEANKSVTEVILVLRDENLRGKYLGRYHKIAAVAGGGERRQDSVLSGFRLIDPEKADIVLVHDGVRPLVEQDLINRVIAAVQEKGAAVPAVPVEETIKLIDKQKVRQTLDREKLFRIQTPQGFTYKILRQALNKAREDNFYGTDEASLVERTGKRVAVVAGDAKNIKITTREDLKIAEALIED
jgi:2-C-methyl-D-erythritol 4-phosphate cytidylyltransferase